LVLLYRILDTNKKREGRKLGAWAGMYLSIGLVWQAGVKIEKVSHVGDICGLWTLDFGC
jgi:drug/metabolite transporter superfamily protein YnfA